MQYLIFLVVGVVATLLVSIHIQIQITDATLIASGSIEQCVDDGSNMECDQKVVITLSLVNEQGAVESLQTTLNELNNGELVLQNPWTITLSKSQVYVRYPLTYVQSFNAQPTEAIVLVDPELLGLANACIDETDSVNAVTCGVARTVAGDYIPDSEGFCCQCEVLSDIDQRGATCSALGTEQESAHCLRFTNELWYSAYELGTYEFSFEITITVARRNSDANTTESASFILSPSNTAMTALDGQIYAKLVGDLLSYQGVKTYESDYLFFPSSPVTHPRVQNYMQNALILPQYFVTLNGLECDKIGVSYSAFKYQSERCFKLPGDCIRNQLEDFHQNGEDFAYLEGDIGTLTDVDTNQIYFSIVRDAQQTSLVSLAISTENVRFVVNRADGHIGRCALNNFESLTEHGLLNCSVVNDGFLEAMFRVSVVNCTNGISPVLEKERTITPQDTRAFTFDIYSENPLDSAHECTVLLFDSMSALLTTVSVEFTSRAQIDDRGAQEGDGPNHGNSIFENWQATACEDYCDSIFDVPCLLFRQCWEAIGKLVIAIVVIFLFGPCLIKFIYKRVNRASAALEESSSHRDRSDSDSDSERQRRRRKRRDRKKRRKKRKQKKKKKKEEKKKKRRRQRRERKRKNKDTDREHSSKSKSKPKQKKKHTQSKTSKRKTNIHINADDGDSDSGSDSDSNSNSSAGSDNNGNGIALESIVLDAYDINDDVPSDNPSDANERSSEGC